MSTITGFTRSDVAALLVAGQRLDQPTFHARYEQVPPDVRAELINGVVDMPSPVGLDHARALLPVLAWLSYYQEHTPGVEALIDASTILDVKSEPQPDAQLRILPECGGQTQTDRRFVRGVPELIVEVSQATRYNDLGPKFDAYERASVLEYIVRALDPDELLWFVLRDGKLVEAPADSDGLHRSHIFPGLWLDPQAMIAGNTRRLREVLDRGLATDEHASFVARLAAARAV